jgi:transposase-like protein
MTVPLFCPNKDCIHHHYTRPTAERWYYRTGFYHTQAFGAVQRFRCRCCGRGFSAQTFRLDYYVKKPRPYLFIFQRITSGSGIRSIGRDLEISHQAIINRLSRLGRQSIGLQAELAGELTLEEDLAADGFESFVSSQYEPNNIHLLVGSKSQFLYAFDYAHLRRKGRMTEWQKKIRASREAGYRRSLRSIPESFAQLMVTALALIRHSERQHTTLFTDKKLEYVRVLNGALESRRLQKAGRFSHVRISSHLQRTIYNPLFPVNYMDRQLRKDNANHVRETVQYSMSVNNCLERVAIYQAQHNYRKPYRVDDIEERERLHGEVAGIARGRIEEAKKSFFELRYFVSRVKLEWSQALVWFRMVGNVDRPCGSYWPAYVWM